MCGGHSSANTEVPPEVAAVVNDVKGEIESAVGSDGFSSFNVVAFTQQVSDENETLIDTTAAIAVLRCADEVKFWEVSTLPKILFRSLVVAKEEVSVHFVRYSVPYSE